MLNLYVEIWLIILFLEIYGKNVYVCKLLKIKIVFF